MRTGFSCDNLFTRHLVPEGHPEQPRRIPAILDAIRDLELEEVPPRDATREELETVHTPEYLDRIAEPVEAGLRQIDADTHVGRESWAAAVRAAGAGLAIGEAFLAGNIDAGFACVRPPGHHAGPSRAMGFCLLNNIAILARMLTRSGKRVAILDWDVHHGNGTQEVFQDDDSVQFCSLHQVPLWPGTGSRSETGAGNILNVPMPPGCGDAEYFAAFDRDVAIWLDRVEPDVLLISAGYDGHAFDPLAQQELSTQAFAAFTRKVAGRPLLAMLEGGYDLDALGASVRATLEAMIEL